MTKKIDKKKKKKIKEASEKLQKAQKEETLEEFKEWAQPIDEKLNEIVKKTKNTKTLKVAVITHDEPDQDALGAILGVKKALQKKDLKPEKIEIFADGKDSISRETRTLITSINIKIRPLSEFNPNIHKSIILVDVGSVNQSNLKIKDVKPDLIIDHHSADSPFESSSTIVTLLMTNLDFEINKELATVLHIGIDLDTNNGTSEKFTDFDDLAYFKILPPLIDNKLRVKIIEPDPSEKYFEMLGNALTKYCVFKQDSMIITGVGYLEKSNKSDIAKIANELLHFARTVFVMGFVETKVEKDDEKNIFSHEKFAVWSVRSKTGTENAADIIERVLGEEAAGGDPVKAGGTKKIGTELIKLIEQAREEKNQEKLEGYFLDILNLYKKKILEEQAK